MIKLVLVCNAGMSTAMLAKKMNEEGAGKYVVEAYGEVDYMEHLDDCAMILVGPQVRHLLRGIMKNVDIPVIGIQPKHYGLLNARGVLDEVENILAREDV